MPRKRGEGQNGGVARDDHFTKQSRSKANRLSNSNFDSSFAPKNKNFTLQEEALSTGNNHYAWDTKKALRHSQIKFVSAKRFEITKPNLQESDFAKMTLETNKNAVSISICSEEANRIEHDHPTEINAMRKPFKTVAEVSAGGKLFVIDTRGSENAPLKLPAPIIRSVSSDESIPSSEEIIVFGGRNSFTQNLGTNTRQSSINYPIKTKNKATTDGDAVPETAILPNQYDCRIQDKPQLEDSLNDFDDLHIRLNQNLGRDEIVADYIENISANLDDFLGSSFANRDLETIRDEYWPIDAQTPSERYSPGKREGLDDNDKCTAPRAFGQDEHVEASGKVQAILSKLTREGRIHYLVLWEGRSMEGACWVSADSLIADGALPEVEAFETEYKASRPTSRVAGSDSSNTSHTGGFNEDEDELLGPKHDYITDEQAAKHLSKHENFGMESDARMRPAHTTMDENNFDPKELKHNLNESTIPSYEIIVSERKPRHLKGSFPDATKLADAYDGFDIMDFERPSLKRKPKGRKGRPNFDISDSELEESLQLAWGNDRLRKRERRQRREELRAQGLLGNKTESPNLKAKYKEGMGPQAIKEELKGFLAGSEPTMAFPPMEKEDRKSIHDLANAFGLKSRSAGRGKLRHTVLYRKSWTLVFDEKRFSETIQGKVARRFVPRMDIGDKRMASGSKRYGRGYGGASYIDGDIVGASAPELGADNKGRTMLEKMGWSKGTALGAFNNKGILEPVSHVVKNSKAGLG